jgi:hypothetical protein
LIGHLQESFVCFITYISLSKYHSYRVFQTGIRFH